MCEESAYFILKALAFPLTSLSPGLLKTKAYTGASGIQTVEWHSLQQQGIMPHLLRTRVLCRQTPFLKQGLLPGGDLASEDDTLRQERRAKWLSNTSLLRLLEPGRRTEQMKSRHTSSTETKSHHLQSFALKAVNTKRYTPYFQVLFRQVSLLFRPPCHDCGAVIGIPQAKTCVPARGSQVTSSSKDSVAGSGNNLRCFRNGTAFGTRRWRGYDR